MDGAIISQETPPAIQQSTYYNTNKIVVYSPEKISYCDTRIYGRSARSHSPIVGQRKTG
jgi:hypothetical protein